jgi:hypothetical protein
MLPSSDSFEPACCFAPLSLEATNRLLFCHCDIDAMDVVRALEPVYEHDDVTPQDVKNQEKVLSKNKPPLELKKQGILVDVLCESDQKFLRDFVWFATGYMYLPQRNFTIKVEFNSTDERFRDELALPMAHTCDMLVKLPGKAYDASPTILQEKLIMSIKNALVMKFDMK